MKVLHSKLLRACNIIGNVMLHKKCSWVFRSSIYMLCNEKYIYFIKELPTGLQECTFHACSRSSMLFVWDKYISLKKILHWMCEACSCPFPFFIVKWLRKLSVNDAHLWRSDVLYFQENFNFLRGGLLKCTLFHPSFHYQNRLSYTLFHLCQCKGETQLH